MDPSRGPSASPITITIRSPVSILHTIHKNIAKMVAHVSWKSEYRNKTGRGSKVISTVSVSLPWAAVTALRMRRSLEPLARCIMASSAGEVEKLTNEVKPYLPTASRLYTALRVKFEYASKAQETTFRIVLRNGLSVYVHFRDGTEMSKNKSPKHGCHAIILMQTTTKPAQERVSDHIYYGPFTSWRCDVNSLQPPCACLRIWHCVPTTAVHLVVVWNINSLQVWVNGVKIRFQVQKASKTVGRGATHAAQ